MTYFLLLQVTKLSSEEKNAAKLMDNLEVSLVDALVISHFRLCWSIKHGRLSKLPGHPLVLQLCTSVDSPAQSRPPLLGGGFVHDRRRPWTPPPHDWEQSPHSAQADQSPWTDIKESRCHSAHVAENLRVIVKTKVLLLNYPLRVKPRGEMGDHGGPWGTMGVWGLKSTPSDLSFVGL